MSKLIDATNNQVLRGYILQICKQAEPSGAGPKVIKGALSKEGISTSMEEIQSACNYLKGKELVEIISVKNEALNISRDIVHITPIGTDVLEGTKSVEGIELI